MDTEVSHWNYRVLERETDYGETTLAVYEVYYDSDGNPVGHTQEPIAPEVDAEFENVEDLKKVLEAMKQAADKPVLEYDSLNEK